MIYAIAWGLGELGTGKQGTFRPNPKGLSHLHRPTDRPTVRPTDSPTDYTAPVLDVSRAPCACACARARRVVYKRHNAYEVANVVMYARDDDDDERRARDINNKDVYAECPNSTPPNVRTPTTTTGDDDDACPRRDEDGARQTTTTTIDDRIRGDDVFVYILPLPASRVTRAQGERTRGESSSSNSFIGARRFSGARRLETLALGR